MKRYRSAVTGRLISRAEAEANPDQTVSEKIEPTTRKAAKRDRLSEQADEMEQAGHDAALRKEARSL